MSEKIFAPLVIRELYVLASDFRIAGSPSDNMDNKLEFALNEDLGDGELCDGALTIAQTLSVSTRLVSADNPEDERMRASATIYIRTECKAAEDGEDYLGSMVGYMRASGVSIAYGHARSCIAAMTAMSPMGSFLIPTVNPAALLDRVDGDKDGGNDEA